MAVFKCKMCGGKMEFEQGTTIGVCEYCGAKQTLPRLENERIANLYDRADHYRRSNDYDKAMGIYEQILSEDKTDAETYWSMTLCRYGIEYAMDPATQKRVPHVNRVQYTSILADKDYRAALQYADRERKIIYENEAKAIEEIQRGMLAVSQKVEAYDVFVCYKETDANGRRTQDSILAGEMYQKLTKEGLRVFFSQVALEDKIGTACEPYIFAALNSAKVMVVLGTKAEYFNAVWVKNEWSRFLALIGESTEKVLIPVYRDMDPYDLPEAFFHLRAQDMAKPDFMKELVEGVERIVSDDMQRADANENPSGGTTALLQERVFALLEDGKWQEANECCDKVLEMDPKNADAYIGKRMAELQVGERKDLADCDEPFDERDNYANVLRFGGGAIAAEMRGYNARIRERKERIRLAGIYENAKATLNAANTAYKEAADLFASIPGYEDADEMMGECGKKIEETEIKEKAEQSNEGNRDGERRARSTKRKKTIAVAAAIAVVCVAALFVLTKVIIPNGKYRDAVALMNEGKYEEAIAAFIAMDGYKDSADKAITCLHDMEYYSAVDLMDDGRYEEAIAAFGIMNGYRDSADRIMTCRKNMLYDAAVALLNDGKYQEALPAFEALDGYKDSEDKAAECSDRLFEKQKEQIAEIGIEHIETGDIVCYGYYEQDNNTANGKEQIQRIVLDVVDNKALVISRYALDGQPYNDTETDVTWETCTLRKWLNDSFLNTAFSSKHQEGIPTVTVPADRNPSYDTDPGNATADKVLLLSVKEAERYFLGDHGRICVPTEYSRHRGLGCCNSGLCWWWLRSPGYDQNDAAQIDCTGTVVNGGYDVNMEHDAVRPAMWIDLDF